MTETVDAPRRRVARWVSAIGHPFVLVPLTTLYGVARRNGMSDALGSAGAVALATVVPVLALVVIGVRRSAWSDHDVSDRQQRGGFYKALFLVLPLGTVALWLLQPSLRSGLIAAWAVILASMAANRFVKSSLHVAFAAFCAASLPLPPAGALAAGLAVIAIAWSRLELKRHTAVEVALGAVIGLAAGLALRL